MRWRILDLFAWPLARPVSRHPVGIGAPDAGPAGRAVPVPVSGQDQLLAGGIGPPRLPLPLLLLVLLVEVVVMV